MSEGDLLAAFSSTLKLRPRPHGFVFLIQTREVPL